MKKSASRPGIGNRLAPPRFVLFAVIAIITALIVSEHSDWRMGAMMGFDLAAAIFLLSVIPLYRRGDARSIRQAAIRNDANRAMLLAITGMVMLVILVAIAADLSQKDTPDARVVVLIIVTLALAWAFSNLVYALHYAHLFYGPNEKGDDRGGIDFPATDEPDYWDFTYFAFTLGMTFQTSDTDITSRQIRRVATFHGLAAFVFNIGVLAFTINVLGG